MNARDQLFRLIEDVEREAYARGYDDAIAAIIAAASIQDKPSSKRESVVAENFVADIESNSEEQQSSNDVVGIDECVLPAELDELVDCAALPPLTPQQAKVFLGFVSAVKEVGSSPSYSEIARHSNVAGVAHHLPNLEAKGYIKNFGSFGAPDWHLIATGNPRIEEPKDTRGRAVRPWTEEEANGLSELAPALGDDYAKYAEKIDRTLDAIMQKARGLGVFNHALVPGYSKQKPEIKTNASVPQLARPVIDRPVTRVVRRIDNTTANQNVTSDLMGDPAPGRSAAEKNEFDVRAYLVKKGHTAFMAGLTWVIDGRNRTPREVLEIVNGHRSKADLPPLDLDAIP